MPAAITAGSIPASVIQMDDIDFAKKCAVIASQRFGGMPDDYLSEAAIDAGLSRLSADEVSELLQNMQ